MNPCRPRCYAWRGSGHIHVAGQGDWGTLLAFRALDVHKTAGAEFCPLLQYCTHRVPTADMHALALDIYQAQYMYVGSWIVISRSQVDDSCHGSTSHQQEGVVAWARSC